jgi:hypothetical protein
MGFWSWVDRDTSEKTDSFGRIKPVPGSLKAEVTDLFSEDQISGEERIEASVSARRRVDSSPVFPRLQTGIPHD